MESEISFALNVIGQAAKLTKRLQQENLTRYYEKEDKSPVTIADFSSQLLVSHFLHEAFPGDRLLAEENIGELSGEKRLLIEPLGNILTQYIDGIDLDKMISDQKDLQKKGTASRYWVLDPIDGTKGFLRGEQFVVALALIENHEPVLGVLGCPNLDIHAEPENAGPGILAYAIKGRGAWIQEQDRPESKTRLQASTQADASKGRMVMSVESTGHSNNDAIRSLQTYLHNQEEIAQFDSQAKYVMVAAGKYDLFLRLPPAQNQVYREKVWDHAAGALLIQEAGGKVSDVSGKPFDFSLGTTLSQNSGVVVSNGILHQQIIDFLCAS